MESAVVGLQDNIVYGVIMADPTDPPPDGCFLVGLSDGVLCLVGWLYDPETGLFYSPTPVVEE